MREQGEQQARRWITAVFSFQALLSDNKPQIRHFYKEKVLTNMEEINALTLIKGKERYVFLYDESHRAEMLRLLARYASNPELSFTWYDAAVLSKKIHHQKKHKTSPGSVVLPERNPDLEDL